MTSLDTDLSMGTRLGGARLPAYAPALVLLIGGGAAGLLALLLGWGVVAFVVVGGLLSVVALPAWSAVVEGRRAAMDRLTTSVIWSAFLVALVPLVWLLWVVLSKGIPAISGDFLSNDMVQGLDP